MRHRFTKSWRVIVNVLPRQKKLPYGPFYKRTATWKFFRHYPLVCYAWTQICDWTYVWREQVIFQRIQGKSGLVGAASSSFRLAYILLLIVNIMDKSNTCSAYINSWPVTIMDESHFACICYLDASPCPTKIIFPVFPGKKDKCVKRQNCLGLILVALWKDHFLHHKSQRRYCILLNVVLEISYQN